MKREFKGKLNLNKEKISRFESGKIKGGVADTIDECSVYTCIICGDPNNTRDGGSACKCK